MTADKKSTIVRAYRLAGNGLVRAAFRTLDPVAPALAARWAARIWFTSPRPRPVRTDAPRSRPGERFPVRVPGLGSDVVAEVWGAAGRPTTYLLHGWGGFRGHMAEMVEPLLAAGQRVVALDAPGHGESEPGRLGGRRTTLLEIADALAAVVAEVGPAHAVVAHSGGATATALAVREGLAATRLVFVAPMAHPMSYFDPFTSAIGLGRRGRGRLPRRLASVIGRDLDYFDLASWAAQAGPGQLPPLLVVHDRADRGIRYSDGWALAGAWPGAALRTTEGLGHYRILAAPEVIEAAVSFVTEPALSEPAPEGSVSAATAAGSIGRS